MRWLILTDDFPPLDGGIATWAAAVAAGLAAAGDEITVLARMREGLETTPQTRIRILGVRGPSFARYGTLWLAAAALPHLRRVDRVLATTWTVATTIVHLCRAFHIPLFVIAHGSDVTRPPRDERGFRRVLTHARWFAVSRFLADLLATHGVEATVLPSPVDAAACRPPTPSTGRWAYIGRATALKGGDRFVRLVAHAGVEGTIFGDGPMLSEWRSLATSTGAKITFASRVPRTHLMFELPTYNLVLLLPRVDHDGTGAEGFGLALVEAAAVGVATVGCRTGGVPEAVGAGLIVANPDDVAATVDAIAHWATPDRGRLCWEHVREHHGVRRVVEHLRLAMRSDRATPGVP